ncbi:DUF262 domain-containing HNH endonuclease family protein [Acinetobacter baumannii]|jgi:hypothetical protein|uniref:DUF262 domain-containing protein n=2 Tax=Acinetobacter calcoaceticus/baumannii complex TaxID=909768 RepID=A0A2L1VJD9_ACINO|nr:MULTISPECIES: DUF262 domain-containing protein [Acinetobacter calcoaceticus/baumannii complex]AVF45176.1 DUF262 domain-containing protein [Acinetobacter nosocomialis]KHO17443.1 hypothetical protein NT90_00250 [Acinetobacter baumannii]MDA3512774.1 DUF262 domain-containing HNH endonuclease family protein [Acinetobacter baumannii]MDA3515121.1 DUF262 domain-containing HNH endonuclease family protein [Acinetobacter baumannii]MDX8205216.1 DUF262 domain-containing HNH endonuclease family protein [
MPEFQSNLITLKDVIDQQYFFNIPIYQRLYVWGKEQIHTLLDDIVTAWLEGKNEFYLGGTLVIERAVNELEDIRHFDLIDGQQRFTTLWLIGVVLREHLAAYTQVDTKQGKRQRISFSIRPQVTKFFEKVCEGLPASLPEAMQLEDALQEIRAYFDNYSDKKASIDKRSLSKFILNKVQLILTTVPEHTDLNKLFEVINNRGVQLQHHEILKAKLLEHISSQEREAYALLWDACANMNGYVERHLKATTKLDTVSLYERKVDFKNGQREQLANAKAVLDELREITKVSDDESMKLEDILNSTTILTTSENDPGEDIDSGLPDRVTSIITFSMLLQHVLRIYLQQNNMSKHQDIEKISDKDLLLIFKEYWLDEKPKETDVKQFFELLWEVRYQFDKHVIKWILVEEEKQHSIRRMRINHNKKQNAYYLQRDTADASPDFALLQSMLYHSQQMTTQYWLTPLLKFLLENHSDGAELYLQHLDNHLLCGRVHESLIVRTRRFLQNLWHEEKLIDAKESLDQKYENGTQYPHYWFYKLEYVLYLKHKRMNSRLVDNFRITSKNSVEHVTPQNPEQKQDEIPAEILHNFGNLALVTKSINSEMSNKGFSIKKIEFEHRYRGKGVSLKLEEIYKNDHWHEHEISYHQKQMIEDFNEYMQLIGSKVSCFEK